jgi:spore germination protein YaaH
MKRTTTLICIIAVSIIVLLIYTQYPVQREVQGFYSLDADQSDWKNLRFDLLSTLILYFIHPTADGNIDINDSNVPSDLVKLAHKNGAKVVISIQTEDKSITDAILTTSKEVFQDNLLLFIQKNNLDGVDIDIEEIGEINSITQGQNRPLMTSFMKDLEVKLRSQDPDYRISINVGGYYPDIDKVFDLKVIKNSVNFIMVMGYDYHWFNSPTAGSVAPMDSYGDGGSIRDSMNHYSRLVDKSKLLLGVPYYGLEWSTKNGDIESPTTSQGTYFSYREIKNKKVQHGRIWDDTWKTPWYKYQSEGLWYQGHYDDVESLGIKYDLVNSLNIAGIGIWELEYGSGESELWQLIQDKFGNS